jgi:hypothetical protein
VSPGAIDSMHNCLSAALNCPLMPMSNGFSIYTILLVIVTWLVLLIFNVLLTLDV